MKGGFFTKFVALAHGAAPAPVAAARSLQGKLEAKA